MTEGRGKCQLCSKSLPERYPEHRGAQCVILGFGAPGKRASVLVFSGERAAAPGHKVSRGIPYYVRRTIPAAAESFCILHS